MPSFSSRVENPPISSNWFALPMSKQFQQARSVHFLVDFAISPIVVLENRGKHSTDGGHERHRSGCLWSHLGKPREGRTKFDDFSTLTRLTKELLICCWSKHLISDRGDVEIDLIKMMISEIRSVQLAENHVPSNVCVSLTADAETSQILF